MAFPKMRNIRRAARGRPVGRAVGEREPNAAGAAGGGGAFHVPRPYGILLALFGLVAWPVGAWFTLAGWVWVINQVLTFIHAPWVVPAPSGLIGVGVAGLIGWLYSRVELRPPPLKSSDWRGLLLAWAAWLIVIGTDAGTTYAGLASPGLYAAGVAAALTFAPDQAIMRGIRIIRGRSPF